MFYVDGTLLPSVYKPMEKSHTSRATVLMLMYAKWGEGVCTHSRLVTCNSQRR